MDRFLQWIIGSGKWVFGTLFGFWGFISPIHPLIWCCIIAIVIDFVTGNVADYYRQKRAGRKYGFESEKAWKTIWKLGLVLVGVGFAWMIDTHVLGFLPSLHLANFFAAFVIGIELWSYLENAAEISDHPVFKWLKKYMKDKLKEDIDFDKHCKNDDNDEQRTAQQ